MQAEPTTQQNDARPLPKSRRRNLAQLGQDLAFKALRAQGVTQAAAAKALGLAPESGYRLERRLKETAAASGQEDPIQALGSRQRDEKTVQVIDHFLDAGARMPRSKIKGSDVTTAVKLYADRRWPAKSDQAPPSINFTTVNLIEIRDPAPQPALDVTPTPTRGIQALDMEPAQDSDQHNPAGQLDNSDIGHSPVMSIMSNE